MKKIILVSFFLFARIASAQVVISEIMYDPQGGDTGHEWVEVVNQGSASVDLLHSKFVEGGSSHGLTSVLGATNLLSGAYAIIADNAQTFLSDHASFSGAVLDSSFSLKNTGETISFKTPDGNIPDTVSYTSDMGASGDGNSLQKINGAWKGVTPTPGIENIFVQNTTTPSSSNVNVTNASSGETSNPQLKIAAEAGPHVRAVLAGEPVLFEGNISGLEGSSGATQTSWSFGDGASGEGASVSHTYYYPGEYTAVIDVTSGTLSASDRMLVRVVAPNISLQTGGDAERSFIALENQGSDDLDLSGWQIVSGEKKFIFPKNTMLGARKTVTLASEVTGLVTPMGSSADLLFPGGAKVATKIKNSSAIVAVSSKEKTSQAPVVKKYSATPAPLPAKQEASVLGAFSDPQALPKEEAGTLWPWYTGAAFLAALALLGLRLTRENRLKEELSADDFEIIEETDIEEPH